MHAEVSPHCDASGSCPFYESNAVVILLIEHSIVKLYTFEVFGSMGVVLDFRKLHGKFLVPIVLQAIKHRRWECQTVARSAQTNSNVGLPLHTSRGVRMSESLGAAMRQDGLWQRTKRLVLYRYVDCRDLVIL